MQYARFHATTWRNLQYLRGTLHGMAATLAEAIESEGETDAEVFRSFSGFDFGAGPAFAAEYGS